MSDIAAQMLKFSASLNVKSMSKDIVSLKKDMARNIRDAFSTGMENGLSLKYMDKVRGGLTSTAKEISLIQKKMYDQMDVLKNKDASIEEKRQAAMARLESKNQLKLHSENLQNDLTRLDKMSDYLEQMNTDNERSWAAVSGKSVETFADGMQGVFSDIMSKDVPAMMGLIQKGASKLQDLQKKAVASRESGAGGMMSKVADVLENIGPALMMVGALAAGFAAVAKIIIDTDAQAKDFHRTLMESGASVGDLVGGTENLNAALTEMRDVATDLDHNFDWGTLAEDQLKILGAWTEAGYTLKEMAGDLDNATDRMGAYQKATSAALTYANLLGESADKIAQDMTGMMEQLGMSLKSVQKNFASIYDSAQMSGFGTKRFFGMVLQATTGMSMYNVRLEQTSAMLMNLSKILGTSLGPDFFNKLTKGFSEESYEESWKRIQFAGKNTIIDAIKNNASSSASIYMDTLKDSFGGDTDAISEALGSALGIKGNKLKDMLKGGASNGDMGNELVSILRKMTPEEQSKAFGRMQLYDPELARRLKNLVVISQGISGKTGDLIASMDALDPAGTMEVKMKGLTRTLGLPMDKLNKASYLQRKIVEQQLGVSREEFAQMASIGASTEGNWKALQEMSKKQKKEPLTGDELKEIQEKQIKAYGAYVTESGKVFAAKINSDGKFEQISGELTKSTDLFGSTVRANETTLKKSMSDQERMAKAIADSTTDITKYLQMRVEKLLNGIYDAVIGIKSLMFGMDKDEVIIQNKAIQEEKDRTAKLLQVQSKQKSELDTLIAKREAGGSLREIGEIDSDIAVKRKELQGTAHSIEYSRKVTDIMRNFTGVFFDKNKDDLFNMAADEIQKQQDFAVGKKTIVSAASGTIGRTTDVQWSSSYDTGKLEEAFLSNGGSKEDLEKMKKESDYKDILIRLYEENQKAAKDARDSFIKREKEANEKEKLDKKTAAELPDKIAQANSREQLRKMLVGAGVQNVSSSMMDSFLYRGNNFNLGADKVSDIKDRFYNRSQRIRSTSNGDSKYTGQDTPPKKENKTTNFYLAGDAHQSLVTITRAQKAGVI